MKITRETVVDASADFIWNVLGPGYADADKWASSVHRSSGRGEPGSGPLRGKKESPYCYNSLFCKLILLVFLICREKNLAKSMVESMVSGMG